jgi:hypothetical protein
LGPDCQMFLDPPLRLCRKRLNRPGRGKRTKEACTARMSRYSSSFLSHP